MRTLTRIILPAILILALGNTARGQTTTNDEIMDTSLANQRTVVMETFMRPG